MYFRPVPASPRVLGLSGSPTHPSRTAALLNAALGQLARSGATVRSLALRELPADALLAARLQQPDLAEALQAVAAADVVLVATPIYKAAYSGLLKAFLDLLPQDGLRGKVVLPLATGGSVAHLLALDYALKPVLGALGARLILDPVFATDQQFTQDERHGRQPDGEVLARLGQALAPLTRPALDAGHEAALAGLAPALFPQVAPVSC